jgi:predicted DNA-binding WGR domain protein
VVPVSSAKADDRMVYTHLISENGERFWEVAQKELELNIGYGKVGARGVQVKTFATEDKANLAKEKMVEEQVGSGFRKKG